MLRTIAFSLIALPLLACARPDGDPDAPYVSGSLQDGRQNVLVTSGNERGERTVLVYQPAALPEGPVPLILVLHGGFGTGLGALERYEFEAAADEGGFIVAAPDGTGSFQTWNAGACCGAAAEDDVMDVAFMRNIVVELSRMAPIDGDRVYATGMSNGGAMAYRLACEAADMFAAVAPVAGSQSIDDCSPVEPIAVGHLHGALDSHVPAEGGVGENAVAPVNWPSLDDQFSQWRAHNGCGETEVTRDDDVHCERALDCDDDVDVELCVVANMGHQWPPVDVALVDDPTSDAIDATEYVVDFLLSQRR